jgi:sulfite reductase beta subunit-like hemoprotein
VQATEPKKSVSRSSNPLFDLWRRMNTRPQKQRGFVAVRVKLPRGDLSSRQARQLAEVIRRYSGDYLRATLDQSLMLRWVLDKDVRALFEELDELGLGDRALELITVGPRSRAR